MVSPRLHRLDDTEHELEQLWQRRAGMFQTGKLLSVDEFSGACVVELFGRNGDTAKLHGVGCLVDDPENLLGLTVKLLCETGRVTEGAWILGPVGPIAPLLDTQILAAGSGVLQARDRRLIPDERGWEGEGTVDPGHTVTVNAVRLIMPTDDSLTDGTAVFGFSHGGRTTIFRQVSRDSVVLVLRPSSPFRVMADSTSETFTAFLGVDRTGGGLFDFADAVLNVHYAAEPQPATQRLQLETTSGAGLPYMAIAGRTF